jgi:nucleoside-diphosphate-sugar epimerase
MTDRGPVVILGATGFLGRAVEEELARGGRHIVAHSSRTLDLRRPDALGVLDAVVGEHTTLLLVSALTPDKGQTIATFEANVAIVANVARYLQTHRIQRCVYIGSDAVYGFDVNPVTETTPVAPGGYYGLAKYAGEKLVEYLGVEGRTNVLSLRVAGLYGPGDPHGSYGPNSFARSLAAKRMVRMFGGGEETRDHLYVTDAARLVTALLDTDVTGVLNVATGESRAFREVVDVIRGLVPYEVTVEAVPRKGPVTHRHYDTSRLRDAVPGFSFTPLADGLRATLTAFGAIGQADVR